MMQEEGCSIFSNFSLMFLIDMFLRKMCIISGDDMSIRFTKTVETIFLSHFYNPVFCNNLMLFLNYFCL